jgi:hypothetical protein
VFFFVIVVFFVSVVIEAVGASSVQGEAPDGERRARQASARLACW